MVRALCLTVSLLVLQVHLACAEGPAHQDANAALKYWQAFATLPTLTNAEHKQLGDCLTMPLDARARETVAKARYALDMVARGAQLAHCDWGMGYEEGVGTLLPQAAAARLTANLACLRARIRFEEGQPAAAAQDVIATLTLGRRISLGGINSQVLTSYAIEHRMNEVLARYLTKLDAQTLKAVRQRLEALPAAESLAAALKVEERFALDWLVGKIKETKDRDSLLALLGQLSDSPEKGRAVFNAVGGTTEGVLKLTDETRQCYARMAREVQLPLDQFRKAWDEEVQHQAGNPVFQWVFPALAKVRLAELRAAERRALLLAAVDVQLEGPESLKNHPEPVAGGPFEYTAFPGGFELRAKWTVDDTMRSKWNLDEQWAKPLTLTIGERGK
jgi:hypothetical protein